MEAADPGKLALSSRKENDVCLPPEELERLERIFLFGVLTSKSPDPSVKLEVWWPFNSDALSGVKTTLHGEMGGCDSPDGDSLNRAAGETLF